jgi:subtilisin family serine protease
MRTSSRTWLACALLWGLAARAQVNLPLPPVIQPPPLAPVLREEVARATNALPAAVSSVRARARTLVVRYPAGVERDPRGAAIMRAVIVALAPDAAAIARAQANGFVVQSDVTLDPFGERLVTLLVPRGTSTARALRDLRTADPEGSYDFDHLFVESSAPSGIAAAAAAATGAAPHPGNAAVRIGMVDSGVDLRHAVFAAHPPEQLGCDGRAIPSAHGTAIASLLVGDAQPQFRGAAPGAALIAVDVYCGADEPGGRVRDIAAGLALLAQREVRVVNLSFVGPPNLVLERVVKRMQLAGILIVAAAGNDGPNAKPLYPAAYPGVIAVTGVDARNKLLLEACRGEHIAFAAPGADMMAAAPGGNYAAVRGTSYAAPLVAGLLARELVDAGEGGTAAALQRLAALAVDGGRRGRDKSFGQGILAQDLRTAPAAMAARPQH